MNEHRQPHPLKQQLLEEYRAVSRKHVGTYTARQLAGFFLACGLEPVPPYNAIGTEVTVLIEAALRQEYARKHTSKRTVYPNTSKNIVFHTEQYDYLQQQGPTKSLKPPYPRLEQASRTLVQAALSSEESKGNISSPNKPEGKGRQQP